MKVRSNTLLFFGIVGLSLCFLQAPISTFKNLALSKCEKIDSLLGGSYAEKMWLLKNHLKRVSKQDPILQAKVLNALDATLFVDWEHYFPSLFKVLVNGREFKRTRIESLYTDADFKAYQEARKYIQKHGSKLNLRVIESAALVYSRNLPVSRQVANVERGGNEISGIVDELFAVSAKQVQEVNKNPYLRFRTDKTIGDKYSGFIDYPSPYFLKVGILRELKQIDPDLVGEIAEFGLMPHSREKNQLAMQLSRRLIETLVKILHLPSLPW